MLKGYLHSLVRIYAWEPPKTASAMLSIIQNVHVHVLMCALSSKTCGCCVLGLGSHVTMSRRSKGRGRWGGKRKREKEKKGGGGEEDRKEAGREKGSAISEREDQVQV